MKGGSKAKQREEREVRCRIYPCDFPLLFSSACILALIFDIDGLITLTWWDSFLSITSYYKAKGHHKERRKDDCVFDLPFRLLFQVSCHFSYPPQVKRLILCLVFKRKVEQSSDDCDLLLKHTVRDRAPVWLMGREETGLQQHQPLVRPLSSSLIHYEVGSSSLHRLNAGSTCHQAGHTLHHHNKLGLPSRSCGSSCCNHLIIIATATSSLSSIFSS